MSTTLRELVTKWGFDVDTRPLQQADKLVFGLTKKTILLGTAITGLIAGTNYLLKEAGKQERTQIAFETLAGSVEKANKLIADMFLLARKTPFLIPEIESNTKMLLALGIATDDIIPTLSRLSDVAAGLDKPLYQIALAYGQVKNKGRLMAQELTRQFAEAGVPLISVLMKQFNLKNEKELLKLVSANKILFKDVEKAFITMTSKGEPFYRMSAKLAKTLPGVISNIIVSIQILSRRIGAAILPQAKKIANEIYDYLEKNEAKIIRNSKKGIEIIITSFKKLWQIMDVVISAVKSLTDMVGGLNNALKILKITLGTLFFLDLTKSFGKTILKGFSVINLFRKMSLAARFAAMGTALLPIAVGTLFTGIILAIEDIYTYFKGGNSLTERIIKALSFLYEKLSIIFGKWKEAITNIFGKWKEAITNGAKNMFKPVTDEIDKIIAKIEELEKNPIIKFFLKNPTIDFLKQSPIIDTLFKKTSEEKEYPDNFFMTLGRPIRNMTNAIGNLIAPPNTKQIMNTAYPMNTIIERINAPITINVPMNTPTENIGNFVKNGVQEGIVDLSRLLRQTQSNNEPAFVY